LQTLRKSQFILYFILLVFTIITCKSNKPVHQNYELQLLIPKDNLLTDEKIELGKKLFFDKRLSIDETVSCATCHVPEKAFTDGLPVSKGVYNRLSNRNAPSLFNVGYFPKLMFDGEISTLEMQVIVPIQEHNEMGMSMKKLIEKLRSIPEYQLAAKKIFNREFDPWVLTRSISAFERTLISLNAPFDDFYKNGRKNAISSEAKKGWKLFSEKLNCIECHQAPLFTNNKVENNGLVNEFDEDKGRFRINSDSSEIGKFKVPSLRNVELTAPYMHDGRFSKLKEVIQHYKNGGNNVKNQSELIQKFQLSHDEERYLVSFLKSLTDRKLKM
jgi:cytochrome c peroxidase